MPSCDACTEVEGEPGIGGDTKVDDVDYPGALETSQLSQVSTSSEVFDLESSGENRSKEAEVEERSMRVNTVGG